MSTPVLDVRGLAFAYPDGHQALFGVDLHVHRGERVALLGPNGAGKTTLVLHLNGILTAGRGSVTVSGLPVAREHLKEIRRRVGIVFQDPDDQLFMPTVRDDVAFGPANLGLRGAELEARVDELANAAKREPSDTKLRRYTPAEQVVARIELAGPERRLAGTHAGVDVHGDGSTEAYVGRIRRESIDPTPGEGAAAALRRVLHDR